MVRFDVDWEADFDRYGNPENAYPVATLTPSQFACKVCGLNLADSAEIKAAELPERIEIEDVDPKDFYDEPDY